MRPSPTWMDRQDSIAPLRLIRGVAVAIALVATVPSPVDARSRWSALPNAPIAGRAFHSGVWTGSEMIVWGGSSAGSLHDDGAACDPDGAEFGDGAAYDPEADRWRELPPAPVAPRTEHAAVWTGDRMLVWGGHVFGKEFADGAVYDPKTDGWSEIAASPLAPRFGQTAVWTGEEMLVWGGATQDGVLPDG